MLLKKKPQGVLTLYTPLSLLCIRPYTVVMVVSFNNYNKPYDFKYIICQ